MFLITEAVTHADAANTIASIENVTIIVASIILLRGASSSA
jgi:hypothetical protein